MARSKPRERQITEQDTSLTWLPAGGGLTALLFKVFTPLTTTGGKQENIRQRTGK